MRVLRGFRRQRNVLGRARFPIPAPDSRPASSSLASPGFGRARFRIGLVGLQVAGCCLLLTVTVSAEGEPFFLPPIGPATLAATVVTFVLAAGFATLLPARRAFGPAPLDALRGE